MTARTTSSALSSREGDRLIGVTGLHNVQSVDRKATFGINIGDRAFQNKGYGTEATILCLRYGFEELNLNRMALSVFSNNPRAIRCYQKAGSSRRAACDRRSSATGSTRMSTCSRSQGRMGTGAAKMIRPG